MFTDNNPLTHILTSAKLKATGQIWVSALSEFNFDIVYRPGSKNTDADIMFRYPFEKVDDCMKLEISTVEQINRLTGSHYFRDHLSLSRRDISAAY